MSEDAPEPGLYPGIPEDTYHRWQGAVSQSTLKVVRQLTCMHAYEKLANPSDQTEAQSFGEAMHLALLEPALFEDRIACGLGIDRRSTANKVKHAEFEAQNAGKIILKSADFDGVFAAVERIKQNDLAMELLAMQMKEVSVVWVDDETGVKCKGRFDAFGKYRQWTAIADVKTTKADLSDDSLEREIGNWGYDIQAGFYLDGANALAEADRRFFMIFVEKKAPFDCRVIEPDATALFEGRWKYRGALKKWARCLNTGVYPGWPHSITSLGLKPWDCVAEREADREETE